MESKRWCWFFFNQKIKKSWSIQLERLWKVAWKIRSGYSNKCLETKHLDWKLKKRKESGKHLEKSNRIIWIKYGWLFKLK